MIKSKLFKKSLYILSFIVVLLTAVLCAYPGEVVYAASSGVVAFDSTDVLEDLDGMTVDGKLFDLSDYPKDPYGSIQALTFVEYCYSQYDNAMGNYGLYLYLYNPALIAFDENHILNTISMAVEFNERSEPSKYDKFRLSFCSKALNGLFYKFKIVDPSSTILSVTEAYAKLHAGERKYYVSGYELVKFGDYNATEYVLGKQYIYEGFAEGCGDSKNFPLSMTSLGIDYISTNLYYAFYRPEGATSEYGYTQNQLNSAYFSVPNSMIEKYGVLTAVHMQWYEYLTKLIFVVGDPTAYITLRNFIGKTIQAYDSDVRYSLVVNHHSGTTSYDVADYLYNYKGTIHSSQVSIIDTLYYLFNYYALEDGTITGDNLLSYIRYYQGNSDLINGKYYSELFEDYVEDDRKIGFNNVTIHPDDYSSLLNYTFSSKWWQWGWGTHTNNSYSDIEGIREIEADDFVGSTSSICQNLFIDELCYEDFKWAYDEAIENDCTLFLIRFAVTDYTSYPMLCYSNEGVEVASGDHYCARQTVFLDLDVIDVTFCDGNNVLTTIPVVCSPIDAVASASKPIDYSGSNGGRDWSKLISLIVGILLLVIILIVCAPVLPTLLPIVLRGFLWLVRLPIRIVASIFKAVRRLFKRE